MGIAEWINGKIQPLFAIVQQQKKLVCSVSNVTDFFVVVMKSCRFMWLCKRSNKIDWHQIKTKKSLRKISQYYTNYKEFLFSVTIKYIQNSSADLKTVIWDFFFYFLEKEFQKCNWKWSQSHSVWKGRWDSSSPTCFSKQD